MSSTDPQVLDAIVKAYDVRGTVPDQLNADVAHALGVGFARFARHRVCSSAATCDRPGPSWSTRSSAASSSRASTSSTSASRPPTCVYFAAGTLDAPGAMFTASHNPAQYNGVKFCLGGARAGRAGHRARRRSRRSPRAVLAGTGPAPAAAAGIGHQPQPARARSPTTSCRSSTSASIRPLRVVADTANGMGGLVVPAVFERLPQITLEVMYGELDGTFPNHPADPLQPANQRDLQARVVAGGFDVGLAFDGDADRVFVVDETGRGLSGSHHHGAARRGDAAHASRARPCCTT